ncbi:Erg28 domain-containing protein [Phanerochaete sordida]|uniref:Erg28 domain-containing protein n=1 Tax=Phanerochaete sordida TaxID=48140 RepID=A0A9P3LIJ8_9APHY|nr:Erg28 domain-containing protein [Phanerochaete sordida]
MADLFADSLRAYIPPGDGLLPKWILFVSVTALFNTVQNFVTTKLSRRLYSGAPVVTALQARTFGAWTLMSAVVRAYAAYHIHDKAIYDMTLLSFLIAFGHFASEILIYRTAKVSAPALSPVFVSTLSLYWMISHYDYYVRA